MALVWPIPQPTNVYWHYQIDSATGTATFFRPLVSIDINGPTILG